MAETVVSNLVKLAAMDGLDAVGGPMDTTTLILFSNNPGSINPALGMAQFTECTFDGYAAQAGLVFDSAFIGLDGKVYLAAPSIIFEMTGITTLQSVYGYALTDAAKAVFRGAQLFDNPIALVAVSQGFSVEPAIAWGD